MFAEQVRRALAVTPRAELCALAAAVWKGFACGALAEDEAQALAEEIAARKAVPARPVEPRRRVGSRPRSPEAMERRRRWTSSGWLPPQLAARFTMGEAAALATIAAEVGRRGLCRLTIGHIAALAGVGRTTVQNAVRQAAALGILTSEEWRLSAWRSAPNTVRIVSPEWRAWLRMRDRKRAGDHPRQAEQGVRSGFADPARKSGENASAIRLVRYDPTPKTGPRKSGPAPTRGGGFRTASTLRSTEYNPNGGRQANRIRQEWRGERTI